MINVQHVKIDVSIPRDAVRVVAMHPYIILRSKSEEPFQWADIAVDRQLEAIRRTLKISQSAFAGPPANFTIFPEYSIPGTDGVAVINDRVTADDWPSESIIIAGVHGLLKPEYRDLCAMIDAQVSESNAPGCVRDDQWVSCCVIWVKDRDGVIQRWVQPKVRPAWPELSVSCNDMLRL